MLDVACIYIREYITHSLASSSLEDVFLVTYLLTVKKIFPRAMDQGSDTHGHVQYETYIKEHCELEKYISSNNNIEINTETVDCRLLS